MPILRIGTAGWPLPERFKAEFPGREHALARNARRFNAVEINATFHRRHGSPRVYVSAYGAGVPAWCVFDNTAEGEATGDAFCLAELASAHALPARDG